MQTAILVAAHIHGYSQDLPTFALGDYSQNITSFTLHLDTGGGPAGTPIYVLVRSSSTLG